MKNNKFIRVIFSVAVVISMVLSMVVAVNAETFLSDDTAKGGNTKDIAQNYQLNSVSGTFSDVSTIKVEWDISDIKAVRTLDKVWNPDSLTWDDKDEFGETKVDGTEASFTITNYSANNVYAKVAFEKETGFSDPIVAFVDNGDTENEGNGRVLVKTVVGYDVDRTVDDEIDNTATVDITLTPVESDFAELQATTGTKYGTYTVSISDKAIVTFNGTTEEISTFSKEITIGEKITDLGNGTIKVLGNQIDFPESIIEYAGNYYKQTQSVCVVTGDMAVSSTGCVLEGTKITLADGTTKAVQDITKSDDLMVYDFWNGEVSSQKPFYILKHENMTSDVITLTLSNGEKLKICSYQDFFDMDALDYFEVSAENYESAIGKNILQIEDGKVKTATIVKAIKTYETFTCYEINTEYTSNFVANTILTVEPGIVLPGMYEYTEEIKIDTENYNQDVLTYGLYTIEDFTKYYQESSFDKVPFRDFKIAVGKGIIDEAELFAQIEIWAPILSNAVNN